MQYLSCVKCRGRGNCILDGHQWGIAIVRQAINIYSCLNCKELILWHYWDESWKREIKGSVYTATIAISEDISYPDSKLLSTTINGNQINSFYTDNQEVENYITIIREYILNNFTINTDVCYF